VTTVYARIEIDDASLVDMTPEGFAENLGEIIHRALEPLADVTVRTGHAPEEWAELDDRDLADNGGIDLDAPVYRNHYTCANCGTTWTDDWTATCDDDCPKCGTTMTPTHSEDL
jgi:ribosomal protein S27AE